LTVPGITRSDAADDVKKVTEPSPAGDDLKAAPEE
jgi:hypothetical protein